MDGLTYRRKIREYVLARAAQNKKLGSGEARFTQVAPEFFAAVDNQVKEILNKKVDSLTACGRTIR